MDGCESLRRECFVGMRYSGPYMPIEPRPNPDAKRRSRWELLLLLPYLGLCFPALYARQTPALWGFPFFYWYQFAWVMGASCLMGIVYYKARR